MVNKNNLILAGLTGVSAAAVAVLSIGGYFLHKKAVKHRLQELTRRQAMNLAFFDLANGTNFGGVENFEDFYEDDEDDFGDYDFDDYIANLDTEDNDE